MAKMTSVLWTGAKKTFLGDPFSFLLMFSCQPTGRQNLGLRGAGATSLEMKRVLVTGANKGIGFGIVEKLLCEYPDCHVLLGARSAERGEQAVKVCVSMCMFVCVRLYLFISSKFDSCNRNIRMTNAPLASPKISRKVGLCHLVLCAVSLFW